MMVQEGITMRYIAVFEARIHIMKYLGLIKNKGIPCVVQSAPRVLSQSCVSAVYFSYDWDIEDLVTPDVFKIYRIEANSNYKQVYPKPLKSRYPSRYR